MSKVIGIDLGTGGSSVAVVEGGEPVLIADSEGKFRTPSIAAFTKDDICLVGHEAKHQAALYPERTVCSVKREMGSAYRVNIDGKQFAPEDISARILLEMKRTAELYLGEKVTQAVITVPSCFDDCQRQATIDAGYIAGLEVLRIISETNASALAWCRKNEESGKLLVFHIGAGCFDVSVIDAGDGVFEVLSTDGNPRLGGDDFDLKIVDWLADQFRKDYGIDLRKDRIAARRLKEAAEQAKIDLGESSKAYIGLPSVAGSVTGPLNLYASLTRDRFDALTKDLVDSVAGCVKKALSESGCRPDQISRVILTGGSTGIPAIRNALREVLGNGLLIHSVQQGEGECAIGAAIQAGALNGEITDVILLDATSHSLGVETEGHIFTKLIDRNTTFPTCRSQVFSTASDGQTTVSIHVLQGEQQLASENRSLGRFELTGIAPAPRGVPQIEVTFRIDNNGIVNVSARDKATGREQAVTIKARASLSAAEIQRHAEEVSAYEARERIRRENEEVLHHADSLIIESEKVLRDSGSRLCEEDRSAVRTAIDAFRKVRERNQPDEIKTAMEGFTQKVYAIFAKLYQADQQQKEPVSKGPFDEGHVSAALMMLPVLDNLELAAQSAASGDGRGMKEGIEKILKQMQGIYEDLGFVVINRPGEKFNPYLEEAVMQGTVNDGKPGTVCRVLQKGYMRDGKVIRFSRVVVVPE